MCYKLPVATLILWLVIIQVCLHHTPTLCMAAHMYTSHFTLSSVGTGSIRDKLSVVLWFLVGISGEVHHMCCSIWNYSQLFLRQIYLYLRLGIQLHTYVQWCCTFHTLQGAFVNTVWRFAAILGKYDSRVQEELSDTVCLTCKHDLICIACSKLYCSTFDLCTFV